MSTLGLIIGNRGFFPDHLCEEGRKRILQVLKEEGIGVVNLPLKATKFGAVETLADARACADLFSKNREKIDGILVTLPNFGDERAVTDAITLAGLDVPVLVHAFDDDPKAMSLENRADSFCGKMSVCNNLRQRGILYSLTSRHTLPPESDAFRDDLAYFTSVCGVVRGLRHARLGALGARPAAFNTVRYSEKLLDQSGIYIETLDLSEIIGQAEAMKDSDTPVKKKIDAIRGYADTSKVPENALGRMARLGVAIDRWAKETELSGVAIQCWTSMEEYFGVVPCTIMSMLSNSLMPAACEVDVTGLIGMYALQLASGQPSALLDWNNNFGDEIDKCVLFHCSNLPKAFFADAKMDYQAIIADSVGEDNTYGTIVGRIKAGPFTFCRVATDDAVGRIHAYVGEGQFTTDKLNTFGGFGVAEIPNLQMLIGHLCEMGFEHHVAANLSQVGDAVDEALSKYLGWDVYYHMG